MLTLSIIALVCAAAALCIELRRDLMMLQQNSYRNDRYGKWLSQSQDTTSVMRLVTGAVALGALSTMAVPLIAVCLVIAVSVIDCVALLKRKYKKPLVMTRRAWRLYITMLLISGIILAAMIVLCCLRGLSLEYAAVAALALYCFSHVIVLIANTLLSPVEKSINNGFTKDAKRILASMPDLKIIGITGSYGKTSTKHYLNRILSEKYSVTMTPGSFNTPMGVVRTVREYLKPYDEVFIVEMGAKQLGDIKEICDIVHPMAGIITAVGEQHLESFKSIENVQRTKFELADALPADGLAVVNDDFPYVASRKVDNVKCERYAVKASTKGAYRAEDIVYTPEGTDFTVVTPEGGRHRFHTKLMGECNVSNLLAAVIMALYLEVPEDKIAYAITNIEQVEHRLSVHRTPGGVTILDDAFNSNPQGSSMALDVLAMMKDGKRIIVTPGMIELGEKQQELNEAFGRKIAACADIAIVVGEYNRDAILAGIEEADNPACHVHTVDTFAESQGLLQGIVGKGDTVLYENDLPDTFK